MSLAGSAKRFRSRRDKRVFYRLFQRHQRQDIGLCGAYCRIIDDEWFSKCVTEQVVVCGASC